MCQSSASTLAYMMWLQELGLPSVTFEPGALKRVAASLRRLTRIDLSSSSLTDEQLAAFIACRKLKAVDIKNCNRVSEHGVVRFIQGFRGNRASDMMCRLESIKIEGTQVPRSCVPPRMLLHEADYRVFNAC